MRKSRKRLEQEQAERNVIEEDVRQARDRLFTNNNNNSNSKLAAKTERPADPVDPEADTMTELPAIVRSVRVAHISSSEGYGHASTAARSNTSLTSPVLASIDHTIYGHSAQYGYHERIGANADDDDNNDNNTSLTMPLPPFAPRNNDGHGRYGEHFKTPPRRPASPAISVSSHKSLDRLEAAPRTALA
ncbi:hypothetical protein SYNPS1DRAFT_22815 [Syncephalis pseudoplumigaleata]|uniref:Uncharacterized protein n=1 Tax=Syncephalis pseudoplumigaleata TaxID=1712513 RepID=A0A4P9YYK9_9FUNG|nr:hypothetical protein SYNPS1DRAFT_22815 [Syncephalis pseudoplumigaleata]|eukprot:RKP25187.1 hypothetical protein SYNPS1DRAFT_22815 [Syncephalis pseudoplumigaleata]